MNKKFRFQFDNSLGILFKYYYGSISIKDIESSWTYAFENDILPRDIKGFILDYRNSNFNLKINEHTAISDFYKKHLDIFGNCKIAILTNDPMDIVIPILVSKEDEGYNSKSFSTLDAAIRWVLS